MSNWAVVLVACLASSPAAVVTADSGRTELRRAHHDRAQRKTTKRRRRPATGSRGEGLSSLIADLRGQGVKVARAGAVSQPFFSGKGSGLSVNGENVQVFVYASRGAAEAEAKRVSPNGASVGTSMMSWTATPHFFRKGNLIALYVGWDEAVLKALTAVLGPQFAGG